MATNFIQETLRVFSFVFDVITFPVYLALQQPWKRRQLSKRIKASRISADDNQITYRSVAPLKQLHLNLVRANIDTLEKVLTYATKIHADKKCLGTREILSEEDEVQPNGKVFKKYNMGEYKWRTFNEVYGMVANFGRGLRELGLEPRQNVAIFAETRAEWMIAAHGCFSQNISIVTIYATLGDDGVCHAINETEASVVITSHDLLPKFKTLLDKLPNVQTIIYMEDQLQKTKTGGFKSDVRIVSFNEVIGLGKTSGTVASPPTTDDIAIIMYTSGSTGNPKGVLISHRNCVATLKAFSDSVEPHPSDVTIGFLPLAHSFELLVENSNLLLGVPVGYSTPNTLLDFSSKIKRSCKGDATVLKPTAIASVPLILDRVSKGITDKVNAGSALQKSIFEFAFEYKKKWTRRGYTTPLLDKLIFKKIAALMGGRVRVILAGGAPLSPETHEKIKLCFCVDVIQGYGLTETTASATAMDIYDLTFGRVGAPNTTTEIRLRSWQEGGYCVTNRPHPQGEIIIGGDTVSPGYFKLADKTAEEFFDDDGKRWLKTGDIGEFHPDGVLRIIDRKKDLVKLQAGEYVSLGKVESALKACSLIDNICVYGESSKHAVVALIVPNRTHLQDLATREGISATNFEDLCSSSVINKAVLKEINEQGIKSKLQKFEVPVSITLCEKTWTPDSGLLTAAFKLKRKEIQDFYQNDINRMYA